MSATTNVFSNPAGTIGQLNGNFKEVYAGQLEDLIPDGVKLLNMIKFNSKDRQPGNLYHQPVTLGMEHGVTYAGPTDDAFNLNAPVAGVTQDCQVQGNPLVLRGFVGHMAIARSLGDKQAFKNATKFVVANMLRSLAKRLEIELLYGQMGLGTVASVSGATLTITTAEWAPGIWSGGEKMPIEIRDTTGATSRGEYTVASVSLSGRTVTLTASPSGVVATDVVWYKGAYGNEFAGIHKILSTTSGTLFNIPVANFSLFQGNTFSAGSATLTFNKIQLATNPVIEKGYDGGKLLVLVSHKTWSGLMNDQAALRKYDSSYSSQKAENGSKGLVFYGQTGELMLESSIYVKEGYAYILSLDEWIRVGSSEMTFKRPGREDEFFRDLENAMGYELRLWTDQALFCFAPGRNCYITGITSPTS